MNKLAIPAVLAATVLIASVFAFMPVEKATTVHDQIIAALQGANIVRIATDIDNIHENGQSTWSQIVTYERQNSEGAFQIEKLFLCDVWNQNTKLDIGFDVETSITGDDPSNPGKPSLVDHVPSQNPRQTVLHNTDYRDECVDVGVVPATTDCTDCGFSSIRLGGDANNNINVRLHDEGCDSTADTNGAVLVAYIVGIVDDTQMNVIVNDDFGECD